MSDELELRFYAVRNAEGKWFRRKGYGGYGDTWVDDLKKARIYAKIGGARGTSSYFAKHYPNYGVPDIVVFKATIEEVLDENKRVREVIERDAKRKAKSEERRAKEELNYAQRKLAEAQATIARLGGKA